MSIESIFKSYQKDVLGVAYYYTRDVEAAKDIAMDVFEVILKTKDVTAIKNMKAYLLGITRNKSLSHLKSSNKTTALEDFHMEIMEEGTENILVNEKKTQYLLTALCGLKTQQRKCLELFYLKKLSYGAIQEVTSYTAKEVKSYIQNGKRNLKNILQQKFKSL